MRDFQYRPTRRSVLTGAGTLIASSVVPDAYAQVVAAAMPVAESLAESAAQPFNRSTVAMMAREMAQKEYVPPNSELPPEIADLSYEQYRGIISTRENALWSDTDLPFRLHLFHRGFYYKDEVEVSIVTEGESRHLRYSPDLFTFGETVPRPLPKGDIGFAGIRLLGRINAPDRYDEIAIFQGASYFRAVGRDQVYGLSARGLALKTAAPEGEEFPIFRSFWVETPNPDSETIVVHALLDSQSVTGAYRFTIRPGGSTTMDVEAVIFPRVDLDKVGIAPGTSMFFFGPNDRGDVDDYRPEVHDSDGLLIVNGRGERLWRPLSNPRTLQTSAFLDVGPRGFGLAQRDRNFSSYEDIEATYERRPSLWIEPVGDWGRGTVTLVEIPTESEIHDNIVAYWQPEDVIPAGSEYSFAYRIFWGHEPQMPEGGVRAVSTRIGRGEIAGPSALRLFVIDYIATGPTPAPDAPAPTATVSSGGGKIDHVTISRNPANGGWRLTFRLDPEDQELIELRATLDFPDDRVAETWVYRWTA